MDKLDKLLSEEKKRLEDLKTPENMESRLRKSLERVPKKKKKSLKIRVASLLLAVLILGYNMDTLAYYGKKLIGYENIMTGTLKELNNLGKGQIIDKSHTFKNGVKITVDGIMLDDNNMIIFYTLYSPKTNVGDIDSNINITLEGMGKRQFIFDGSGQINEDETEMKWIISTDEIPKFFERTIKFNISINEDNKVIETAQIPFKIDRSQALDKSIRINIGKKVQLSKDRSIKIKNLVASPTTTVIKGEIQNILELGLDYINENRIRPENIEMVLIANGKEVEIQKSGISTNIDGIKFEQRFDALPSNIKDLQLKLVSFTGDFDVGLSVNLSIGQTRDVEILGEDIKIVDVYEKDGDTFITIITKKDTILSRTSLNIDGKASKLQETIPVADKDLSKIEGIETKHARTLRFKGTGKNLSLDIDSIRYTKSYDALIYSDGIDN